MPGNIFMNYNAGYRIKFGHKLTPVIKWLIGINLTIFIFQMILKFNPANYRSFVHIFGLVPVLVNNSYRFWQFFTYMFLHGSFSHIFFNMFGCEIESKWGSRKFLIYYIMTGVGAGIST